MAINLKERFVNALLGTPVQTESVKPYLGYGEKIDTTTESLGEQPYMKPLLNQPKELGLTLDQYKEGFTQGLNYGVPEIAKLQDELGIRKPKTEAEIEAAKASAFNQPTHLVTGTSNTPRQGGFLNDLVSGYRENVSNGFSVDNLAPNEDKGVATRIGEGLGTLARFQSKPIARGLLAGAAALALGGGAGGALAAGLGTAVGRQNYLTKDKAYRQNLQQMGYTQDEIDSIPGMVTDEIYGNLIRAQQLKDNAEYRNMLLKNQQINLDFQKGKEAYDRYITGKRLSLEERKLALDFIQAQNKGSGRTMPAASATALSGTLQGIDQMQTLINQIPDFSKKGLAGPVGSLRRFNPYDADAQAFQQYVNTYKQVIGKGLEGGVLRKEDEAKYEKIIPRMGDTEEVLKRKAKQLQDMLINKYNTDITSLQRAGYNVKGFLNDEEGWAF